MSNRLKMSLRGIKLVTLDATNTILKFRVPPWQHYAVVAQDFGFSVDAQQVKTRLLNGFKIIGKEHPNFGRDSISWQEWWHRIVKFSFAGILPVSADDDGIAKRLIEEFKTAKCWTRAEGSGKLIALLREKAISIGVISNYDPRLHEVLQNISFSEQFQFVLTSYDVGFSKPDKQIFDCAIKTCKASLSPSECLHIGDNLEKDYEGARAAGWHAVLINPLLTETPPAHTHVFKDLDALNLAIEQDKLML